VTIDYFRHFICDTLCGKNNQAMEFASTARIDLVNGPG
jgi:hypothetical protein